MKSAVLAGVALMVLLPPAGAAGAAPSPETHARAEFQKYAARISGKPATIDAEGICTVEGTAAGFAIGRCRLVDALSAQGKLQLPGDLGDEGFLIKSVEEGGRPYMVILGGSARGTLYGVYRYLEQFCRVGFFWDGEHVPQRTSLPVAGLDVVERPRWSMRQYMMDCEYTSYWWDWDQWKAEVDWAAKHRFNVLSSNFDFTATWRAVWKRFGVEVPPTSLSAPPFHPWAGWHNWAMRPPYPAAYQDFQADLARRFTEYGRSVGLKMAPDFRGFLGQVPREFAEAYRGKARFLEVGWVGFNPPGVFLHPDDPLYLQVANAFAEEFLRRFGTDHLWASQSYCEMRPSTDPKEILPIEIALAKRNLEAIRSVDPQAVLFTNSWTFLDRRHEDVKAFLEALPADAFQVWEMPSDLVRGPPMYQQFDYFGGKPWLVGFLYAYGGTTMLHGDLADLVRRAQAAAADPRARMCRGLCIEPEAIHHNPIAFDLISRLAWDPSAVELSEFLEDYAARRYGEAAAPGMVRCFGELLASVYGSPGVECPLYMLRVTRERLQGETPYGVAQARQFLPHLQAALEIALAESDRVGDRGLWQRDLIDIARQFLSDRFDLHAARLAGAFRFKDPGGFRRESESLRAVLASQEMLLSSSDDFCLAPILAKAKSLPNAPADTEERIRDILTIWAGKILDYAHRDYYELVRFYYRKRIEAFLAHAEANLAAGRSIVDDEQLAPAYRQIEQTFVKEPFAVAPHDRYAGRPDQAVREILTRHRLSDAELAQLPTEAFGPKKAKTEP
ncbi:MAG: alpha-N-acetylglucosaminidase C-terminal domain-containing protein [Pirellulales bacterium]|nr:alpha-N-acetylglucosaminidase C-terminal domain-containing protein [Pirellulales bacterium]